MMLSTTARPFIDTYDNQRYTTVRRTNYSIGKDEGRARKRLTTMIAPMTGEFPGEMNLFLYDRYGISERDVSILTHRKFLLETTYFNLNVYSEERVLYDFRCRLEDIACVSTILHHQTSGRHENVCVYIVDSVVYWFRAVRVPIHFFFLGKEVSSA